ncbi:MAG: phosphatase PAP2 family protein [Finegoldia magna]|nr:phosphatase PAP2 family protein [Finegoldia magna]
MLIAIVFAFMIAISRIILGVHWFTDVVIGSFIGLICAYWSIYMFKMNYYFTFIFG